VATHAEKHAFFDYQQQKEYKEAWTPDSGVFFNKPGFLNNVGGRTARGDIVLGGSAASASRYLSPVIRRLVSQPANLEPIAGLFE
jgi:hypothetical protein